MSDFLKISAIMDDLIKKKPFKRDWEIISYFVWTLEKLGLALPSDIGYCWDQTWQEEMIDARRNGGV